MKWYEGWKEFEAEVSAEELKQRLSDAEFLSGYDCTAKLLSNGRFSIASNDGSLIEQQFVFHGNIRKQEQGVFVVGTFGWSSAMYAFCGLFAALYFAAIVAMGYSANGDLSAGFVGAIVCTITVAMFFGIVYVLNAVSKDSREITWKDRKVNSILYFMRRGLLREEPRGRFITAEDLHP